MAICLSICIGSVWIMYSDLFFERVADDFAALSAKMVLVFDYADWQDEEK